MIYVGFALLGLGFFRVTFAWRGVLEAARR